MRLFFILTFLVAFCSLAAQKNKTAVAPTTSSPTLAASFENIKFRNIGPARGGRSTAVAGIPSQPNTFFMGATGGGVWRTDDGGTSWNNISDGFIPVGSIGSIRVALSDQNVMYVGTGSADPRGNVSIGRGIYKSVDAGKTWSLSGLAKGGQIGKLEIHPQNPDLVFAAVLGNPFGPNAERGVYRTKDGGKNWERVLYVNDKTGAMDVVMDPNNSRILYAAMWQVQRKPWTLIDGGPDGGVYQSKDAGDTWKKLEGGLPTGVLGKIGLAVSPANSERVWVLIETPDDSKGGLFRSDDGAKTFTKISADRELRTRHWYYTHVFADPKDQETVYVNNVNFWKSTDGGKNFSSIRVPHGDNHDLWINPNNTQIMIHSNDGGACITYNGGRTWSTEFNQPTSEMYRVEVDNSFPYRVYGCQQDNTGISVSSAVTFGSSYLQDWLIIGGGESGHVAVDPRNPNIIYSGNYTGILERYDRSQAHSRVVTHYPQLHDGLPLHKVRYRYQWNAPIHISQHNPDVVYHCSQFVHKTTDGGNSWEVVSPDLTLNKKEYQELPGGPVQYDYTGVENFNTIFSFEESPLQVGELWAGSDDALVNMSADGGKSWKNVTPPGLPALATINTIDISSHKKGKVYVTAHNYRNNDFKPYIFKTEDYGKTWVSITNGIPADDITRVVREDPNREGLLYGGTEFGFYVSMDDGKTWESFQLNLPRVPVTDLMIKNKDLVMSTQGRSFWILDDLTPLHQWKAEAATSNATLFAPRVSYRTQLGGFYGAGAPTPAPKGVLINFYVKEKPDTANVVKLEIMDEKGIVRRIFSSKPDEKNTSPVFGKEQTLTGVKGMNRFVWDMSFAAPEITTGTILAYGYTDGPVAPPGKYSVKITVGKNWFAQNFEIKKDPRWSATDADLLAQYELSAKTLEELNRVHLAIRKIRSVKTQSNEIVARATKAGKEAELKKLAESMSKKLSALEQEMVQTKNKAGQDPINYPPMFDDQLDWLYLIVNNQDARPTKGCYELYDDLKKQSDAFMKRLDDILASDLKLFNEQVAKENVGGVLIEGLK
jgi:photosystem II stability/assembly factor-like uncharacterized protein